MQALLTTDPGLEEIAATEARENLPEAETRPAGNENSGLVRVEAIETNDLTKLTALRTIHHIIELKAESRATTLDEIRQVLEQAEIPELAEATSFRVTTESAGPYDFTRMQIQGAAGAVLQNRYKTKVDLENPDLIIRVDLHGAWLAAGIQRTHTDLGKRLRRAKSLRSAIKPTIAAAMIRIAGAHKGEGRLIDPLCGTGTIPIEAKEINPTLEVEASDWDEETVETARATIANHDLPINARQQDARQLQETYPNGFDYIITDPPYGVRLAKHTSITRLYRELLESFERALADNGRLVLIVVKFRAFLKALAPTGLEITDERMIETGGLHPRIFTLKRK